MRERERGRERAREKACRPGIGYSKKNLDLKLSNPNLPTLKP